MDVEKERKNKFKRGFWFILITITLVCSIGSYYIFQRFIKSKIHENVVLKNNTQAFEYWKSPSKTSTMSRKYYFFDLQNPDEVLSGTEKPRLVERGPYVYSNLLEKQEIKFCGPDIVCYELFNRLNFNPNLSNGTLDDEITFLNIPGLGLIDSSLHGEIEPGLANFVLSMYETRIFIKRSIRQLLEGYQDDLFDEAKRRMSDTIFSENFKLLMDNSTRQHRICINTGNDDITNIGTVTEVNGVKKSKSNSIMGTDGMSFSPFMERDTKLFAYSPQMCRPFYFVFKEEREIFNTNSYVFHFPTNLYNHSNSLNEGFSTSDDLGDGVISLRSCKNISSYISQPHFLNADAKFSESLIGLNPNEEKHDSELSFEPNTAVPFVGKLRFQLNLYLPSDKDIDIIKNVKPVLLPVFWFEQEIKMDEDIVKQISYVALIINVGHKSFQVVILIGVVSTVILFFAEAYQYWSTIERKKINRLL